MSDCILCEVESQCGYEYKPCDCFQQRKFKPKDSTVIENNNGTKTEIIFLADEK